MFIIHAIITVVINVTIIYYLREIIEIIIKIITTTQP
jgi:hypothetical protein